MTTPVGNLLNDMMLVPAWVLPPTTPPTYAYTFNSGDQFIYENAPIVEIALQKAPIAVSDVTVAVKAFGGFEGPANFLTVQHAFGLGDTMEYGRLFQSTGTDCNAGLDEDSLVIPMSDWNDIVNPESQTTLGYRFSYFFDPTACGFNGTVNTTITYEAEEIIDTDGPAEYDIRSAHKTLAAGIDPVQPEIIRAEMQFDHLTSSHVPVVVDRLGKTNIGGAAVCSIDMGNGKRVSFLGFPMRAETGGGIVLFSATGSCVDE